MRGRYTHTHTVSSVHKLPGKPNWICFFTDRHGRRRAKSTLTANKAQATALCREIEALEKKAKRKTITQDNARKILEDRLEEILSDEGIEFQRMTIKETLTKWLEKKSTDGKSTATVARYSTAIDGLLAFIGGKSDKSISSLTTSDIEGYHGSRIKAGASPSTANLDVKIISAALNHARRNNYVVTNVAEAVELAAAQAVQKDVFNEQEIKRLLEAAPGEWRTVILLAIYTGARLGDCVTMGEANWDRAEDVLRFEQRKTGGRVVVPVHPTLKGHLEKLPKSPEGYFCPGMATAKSSGRNGLSEAFRRIMSHAGVSMSPTQGGGARMVARKSFHSFRHTFASMLANAGVPPEIRKKLTGHHDKSDTHARYTHHELAPLREAIAKLPDLI